MGGYVSLCSPPRFCWCCISTANHVSNIELFASSSLASCLPVEAVRIFTFLSFCHNLRLPYRGEITTRTYWRRVYRVVPYTLHGLPVTGDGSESVYGNVKQNGLKPPDKQADCDLSTLMEPGPPTTGSLPSNYSTRILPWRWPRHRWHEMSGEKRSLTNLWYTWFSWIMLR